MKNICTVLLFVMGLLACLVLGWPVLYALVFGYLVFFLYALSLGFAVKEVLRMSWEGVRSVLNVLVIFLFIGLITASWRASGTIPLIVYKAAGTLVPGLFLLLAFILNCLLSMLTGTAFGTAGTMGVICMSIGSVMGISPLLLGGAILSGCFFGDRGSPMSSSAALVAQLTRTDIYRNVKAMARTAALPFVLTCLFFFLLGLFSRHDAASLAMLELLPANFDLHWLTLIPALLVIALALCKLNVKWIMAISVAAACLLCLFLQHMSLWQLAKTLIAGFSSPDPQLNTVMSGGGIVSMLKAGAIVCLSSSYAGIFDRTGLLTPLKEKIAALAEKTGPFGSTLLTSLVTGAVACNQVLSIILTYHLCRDMTPDKNELALSLENTAVVTAPLFPWSIAAGVPLAAIGAPDGAIFFACYLYLLPLWNWGGELLGRKRKKLREPSK